MRCWRSLHSSHHCLHWYPSICCLAGNIFLSGGLPAYSSWGDILVKSRPEILLLVVELQDKKPGNCYYTVSYISPCHHYEHLGIWPSSRVSMSTRGHLVLTLAGWYGMIYMPIVAEQLFSLRGRKKKTRKDMYTLLLKVKNFMDKHGKYLESPHELFSVSYCRTLNKRHSDVPFSDGILW